MYVCMYVYKAGLDIFNHLILNQDGWLLGVIKKM